MSREARKQHEAKVLASIAERLMSKDDAAQKTAHRVDHVYGSVCNFVSQMGLSGLALDACLKKHLEEEVGLPPDKAELVARQCKALHKQLAELLRQVCS